MAVNPVAITYGVLVVAVLLFVTNRVPVAVVALGVALSLWFTGVVDLGQALAGFGDPTVIFIATLFVVGEGLDAAGVTAWLGRRQRRVVVLAMLMVALLSALITPTGAVAALVPVAVVMCVRLRLSPSQLLMPLAFVAHAGSMLLLTGTPVNVLVADAARDAGTSGIGLPLRCTASTTTSPSGVVNPANTRRPTTSDRGGTTTSAAPWSAVNSTGKPSGAVTAGVSADPSRP